MIMENDKNTNCRTLACHQSDENRDFPAIVTGRLRSLPAPECMDLQ